MKRQMVGACIGVSLVFMTTMTLALTSLLQITPRASLLDGSIFQGGSLLQKIFVPSHQTQSMRIMNGKLPSLGWIVGRDCQGGMQAYLQTADINPDAALVGTGWINPTTGELISGDNQCQSGSQSMDNVVELIHSKGGKAYLTITMDASAWSKQQQSAYIEEGISNQSYVDSIINEVKRAGYDGVIMDLESANADYPNIQQLFADFNKKVWSALKPLKKLYGIALLHKLSDHDEYYDLNGFENWSLLSKSADFIVMMSLDQSYSTPGPTVSIPWLKELLAYAQKTMPQMLPNIIWEFPLYGAKWYSNGGSWVWDGGVNYADAVDLLKQISTSQIDQKASNLKDPYAAHFVYTDSQGVKHSVWYHTADNLRRIIREFKQILHDTSQFGDARFQIAVWYRATWEPTDLWRPLVDVLP